MKLFESHATASYAGGMILIAADSAEDALKLAAEKSEHKYKFMSWDPIWHEFVVKINTDYLSPFAEVPNLSYNGNEPKIILENIYFE